MSLLEWWVAHGWRVILVRDSTWLLAIAVLWLIAALVARTSRNGRASEPASVGWLLPTLLWAVQSSSLALATTQLDIIGSASRVPFMLMYGISSGLAGVLVLGIVVVCAKLVTTPPLLRQRRGVILLSASWIGAGLAWAGVIVRELVLVQ